MLLFIYATDIEEVLKGDFAWSLKASSRDDLSSDWVVIGSVDVDLDIDHETLTGKAVNNIEDNIKDINATAVAAVTSLEARKQSLLSLTHQE